MSRSSWDVKEMRHGSWDMTENKTQFVGQEMKHKSCDLILET